MSISKEITYLGINTSLRVVTPLIANKVYDWCDDKITDKEIEKSKDLGILRWSAIIGSIVGSYSAMFVVNRIAVKSLLDEDGKLIKRVC